MLELSKQVRKDMQLLAYPDRQWVQQHAHPTTGAHVYDVLIVGGGQCGLTTAFGLSKEKVSWGPQGGESTQRRKSSVQ